MYITSGKRTVRLGLLQGLYERFRLGTLSGSSSHTGGTVQARAALVYSMVFTMYFTAFHCFYSFYPEEHIAPVAL